MKENTKVSQDKKAPIDAATEKTKNNSSIRESGKNESRSSNKDESKNEGREERARVDVNTKAPKSSEKANSEKVKTPAGR